VPSIVIENRKNERPPFGDRFKQSYPRFNDDEDDEYEDDSLDFEDDSLNR
jgi:hypothetical protein